MVSLSLSIAFSRSSAELKASKMEWFVPPIQADLGDGVVLFYLQYIYTYTVYIYYMYVHIYITAWWFRPILHWLQIIIQPSFTEPHGRLVGAPTSKLRRWQHWDQLLENVDRVASNSMQNKGVKMLNLYFKIGNLWWPVFVQVCVLKKKRIRVGKTTGQHFPNIPSWPRF